MSITARQQYGVLAAQRGSEEAYRRQLEQQPSPAIASRLRLFTHVATSGDREGAPTALKEHLGDRLGITWGSHCRSGIAC